MHTYIHTYIYTYTHIQQVHGECLAIWNATRECPVFLVGVLALWSGVLECFTGMLDGFLAFFHFVPHKCTSVNVSTFQYKSVHCFAT